MKKIGIVGGVDWQSTSDYYTEICRRSERWNLAGEGTELRSAPEMSIESLDHRKAVALLGIDGDEESWSSFDEYHRCALRRLEQSGAEFALIASNTPHHRFDSIVRGIEIPVIDIFEAVARECARLEADRVLILGTTVTMESPQFRRRLARWKVEGSGPRDESARALTVEVIADLQTGRTDTAAERIEAIARTESAGQFQGRSVVCLACTELSLAFPQHKTLESFVIDGIAYVNSSAVHIGAALEFAFAR